VVCLYHKEHHSCGVEVGLRTQALLFAFLLGYFAGGDIGQGEHHGMAVSAADREQHHDFLSGFAEKPRLHI